MRKLNLKYVKDVIKDDYLNWKTGDSVVIESATGTGKTTFIFEELLPTLKKDEKLLFVCNRKKLSRDTKLKLMKLKGIKIPDDINEVDKMTYFDGVKIINYQALGQHLYKNEFDLEQFKVIVLDECQFWLTDASFNNLNHLTYQAIVRDKFPNSIRIYMSATMQEMKSVINNSHTFYNNLHSYSSGKDYSYLDTYYFKKMNDILQLIKNDNSNDKWLIFVTSKNNGEKYLSELIKSGIDTAFAHAKTEEDYIVDEKFEQKVLILTKAFDNGINIHDDLVKNLVVNSFDETTFLQEIGRARINIKEARTIKLFIPTLSYNTFNTLINTKYKRLFEQCKFFDESPEKFSNHYRNKHHLVNPMLFKLDENNQWQLNGLGVKRLRNDRKFAKEMLFAFKDFEDNTDQFAYIKKQLEWLELDHTFDESKLIEKVVDELELNELEAYLNSISDAGNPTRLYKEQQQHLTELVLNEFGAVLTNVNKRTKKFNVSTLETIIRDQLKLTYSFVSGKEDKVVNGKRKVRNYILVTKLNK